MQLTRLRHKLLLALIVFVATYVASSLLSAHGRSGTLAGALAAACPADDSGLQLPPGFCATIFADGIGHARHMAVSRVECCM